jgi:hypothetical protein
VVERDGEADAGRVAEGRVPVGRACQERRVVATGAGGRRWFDITVVVVGERVHLGAECQEAVARRDVAERLGPQAVADHQDRAVGVAVHQALVTAHDACRGASTAGARQRRRAELPAREDDGDRGPVPVEVERHARAGAQVVLLGQHVRGLGRPVVQGGV